MNPSIFSGAPFGQAMEWVLSLQTLAGAEGEVSIGTNGCPPSSSDPTETCHTNVCNSVDYTHGCTTNACTLCKDGTPTG